MKRSTFLKTTSATGLAVAATPNLLLGAAKDSPNEKLNMGIIGSGGRGSANLRGVASENIVALCDINVQTIAIFGTEPQFGLLGITLLVPTVR